MLHVVTPYGRNGPSSRVRVYEWLDRIAEPTAVTGYVSYRNSSPAYLTRHPVAVLAAEGRLRKISLRRPQSLLLHREASPLSRGALERRLLRSAAFAVYDFDDALQWDWGVGGVVRHIAPKAPKAYAAVSQADRVIAGNPVLADWASAHNRDVVLIPSCVAPDSYQPKQSYRLSDPPRIGWIGSPDNEQHLRLIAPALREAHRRSGARIVLIGTTARGLGALEAMIDRIPWSEAIQGSKLAEVDVGIGPLPDDPYSRGKCGYRILQYAAAGVPALGSPVGVNRDILSQLGMAAPSTIDEWDDALADLFGKSDEARAALGRRAREIVRLRYSYDALLPRWRGAVGLSGPGPGGG
ncbi:MAG TPA: glycosyltransferase [Solirubrobacteraceae bacterium]|nr:glycosyltransferase [Solirubrobacteraceae bacterium]